MKKLFIIIFVLLFLTIVWVIFDADNGNKNFFIEIIQSIKYGDKIGHFFIFGTLALFLNLILDFKKIFFVFAGSGIIFLLAFTEEFSQIFFENRTFDLMDLTADILGIFFLTFIFLKINKK